MRKLFIVGSFLLNLFALVYVIYIGNFSSRNKLDKGALSATLTSTLPEVVNSDRVGRVGDQSINKKHKIAILTPVSHPALMQIQKGFEDTLMNTHGVACDFVTYNANGNRTLMRAQVEDIIQKNYDLIFTIGAHATQMAKEVTTKKQSTIPIVFGAVADPVRLNLIASEASSENHLTGAATATRYPDQIALLCVLKPQIKKVLIVYDPTQSSGLEKDKREVEKLLTDRGIAISAVEVYKTSEIHQKIASLLTGVDVVMTFKDNTVLPGIESLVKLCRRNKVMLLCSDLESVDKGAVLGYGVPEYNFGMASAERALHVLLEKKHPSQIPVTKVMDYKIRLNAGVMHDQGLVIDSSMLLLLKSIEII